MKHRPLPALCRKCEEPTEVLYGLEHLCYTCAVMHQRASLKRTKVEKSLIDRVRAQYAEINKDENLNSQDVDNE